ncbi:MAG: hypothetical protein JNK43_08915 [Ignavibacteria bacterium]|nr:hypothetical protein [Ignavibacteria bacterium]
MSSLLLSLLIFFAFCATNNAKQNTNPRLSYGDTCRTMDDAERLANKDAVIYGWLQKYTPVTRGKGSHHMFWNWEIEFSDGSRIPVVSKDKSDGESIVFDEYSFANVVIHGRIFYGTIIGDSDPGHQSASGYRIDADGIDFMPGYEPQSSVDTCRIFIDLEANANKKIFASGKLLKYVQPRDGSKLGDEKIWDYVLEMPDGTILPLKRTGDDLEPESFINRDVFVYGFLKHGIIFGRENTANMTGYRLDPLDIKVNEKGYITPLHEYKIKIDLTAFDDDGYRVYPNGEKSSAHYEFCIPAVDSLLAEVKAIDPEAGEMKGSKGRSGCSDREWLIISSTRKPGFKEIIKRTAELEYVRKITETFWE